MFSSWFPLSCHKLGVRATRVGWTESAPRDIVSCQYIFTSTSNVLILGKQMRFTLRHCYWRYSCTLFLPALCAERPSFPQHLGTFLHANWTKRVGVLRSSRHVTEHQHCGDSKNFLFKICFKQNWFEKSYIQSFSETLTLSKYIVITKGISRI